MRIHKSDIPPNVGYFYFRAEFLARGERFGRTVVLARGTTPAPMS